MPKLVSSVNRASFALSQVETNLQTKLTFIAIYSNYARSTDPLLTDVVGLYRKLLEDDQDAVQFLARQVRVLGGTPSLAQRLEKLEGQARVRRTVGERLRFVRTALERSVAWYQERQRDRDLTAEMKELWDNLGRTEESHLAAVNAVIAS